MLTTKAWSLKGHGKIEQLIKVLIPWDRITSNSVQDKSIGLSLVPIFLLGLLKS